MHGEKMHSSFFEKNVLITVKPLHSMLLLLFSSTPSDYSQ